jgi:pSer/pThr/pTyr-binding forkhead associated (FHA) protein
MAANNTQKILLDNSSTDSTNDLSMATESHENHIFIIEDDQGSKEFILDRPMYSIGRDRLCDIRLFSQFVSRRHATLVKLPRENDKDGFHYRIVDGDGKGKPSSNGIMINGRKMQAHDLKNEDEVVFGPQVRAIYYQLQRDTAPTGHTDATEYDITLINPGGIDDEDDI